MSTRRLASGVALVGVLAIGLWLAKRSEPRSPVNDAAPVTGAAPGPSAPPSSVGDPLRHVNPRERRDAERSLDRRRHDEMLATLRAIYPDAAPMRASVESGRYFRERVRRDFVPLARVCYEEAAARNGTLTGRIVLKIELLGDPKVGGVVASVDPDLDASTLSDPALIDCISQRMLTVTFDPPKTGGVIAEAYPFEFVPGSPEGGAYGDP